MEIFYQYMDINRDIGKSFNQISSLYDQARGGYPEALFADVINFSGLKKGSRVLDVGCGSGQAMKPFVDLGSRVTGVDISPELIGLAAKKYTDISNVQFNIGSFESIDFGTKLFDLIISGMAWHWVDPAGRYEKVCTLFCPGGALALFWSYQRKEASDFVRKVSTTLDSYGGPNRGPAGSRVHEIAEETHIELQKNNLFTDVEMREYEEVVTMDQKRYTDLVFSYGWVQSLSDDAKEKLRGDLNTLYEQHDESLVVPYGYTLVLARSVGE